MSLRNRKWLAAILIVVLVITAATGAVYAYLSATGGSVTNTFTPETDETPTVSVSTGAQANTYAVSVDVGEPGYAVYVRAVVVATWRNGNNVYAMTPSYTVTPGDGWFKQGDFYYYESPVSSTGDISGLTVLCSEDPPSNEYSLHIEVIAQTIQALGTTDGTDIPAVTDAWGIRVDGNGQLYNTVVAVADDTWESLAEQYGVDKDTLSALNGKSSSDEIVAGQIILLPNVS